MYNIKILMFTKDEPIEIEVKSYWVKDHFLQLVKADDSEMYFNTSTIAFFDVREAVDGV